MTSPASTGPPPCRTRPRGATATAGYRLHRKPTALVTIGPKGPKRPRRFRITQHHHGVARGRHQVVALLVNAAILAMIQPKFFEPLIQVLQHFEAPALHPNEHVCNAGLDRHRSILELRMLVQHLEALRSVLIRKRLAGAFQRLASAIPWPRPRQVLAPQFERCRVNDGGCLADAIAFRDVDGVCISVPDQFDRRERVIPSEIHPTDAWPVSREIALLAGEHFFGDGKDAARTQCWHASRARLALVRGIARGNLLLLLGTVVADIVERHCHDATVGRRLEQKPPYYLAHAEQRGEGDHHRPAVDVRAREAFSENVGRRLFIEPYIVQCLALEAFPAALIALEADHRDATGDVPDLDAVEQVGRPAG